MEDNDKSALTSANSPNEANSSSNLANPSGGGTTYGTIPSSASIAASIAIARESMPHTTTNNQSMMHLMKGMVGTGILAMPSAFKNAGLWVGTVGVLVMGVICVHCMHLLVKSCHELCARTGAVTLDYGGVVKQAFDSGPLTTRKFSKVAVVAINVFISITQYGFCCVYMLFIGKNIQAVVVSQYPGFTLHLAVYMVITLVLLLPVVYIRRLKHLAWFSLLANVFVLLGLIIILQWCFQDLPPVSRYPAFNSWATFPLYFGTAVFAFEGIGVVLPIENKMKTPEDFVGLTGVLNTGMVIVTVLYTSVGFYGYLKAGEDVCGSITLNLPGDNWLYLSVDLLISVAIFFTYPLQFFVPHNIVWPLIRDRIRGPTLRTAGEYIFKTITVIITFLLAVIIPHLDLMISLIGALASTAIALVFPPLLEIVVFWPAGGLPMWALVKDILLLIFAVIGFTAGTVTALIAIIQSFIDPDSASC